MNARLDPAQSAALLADLGSTFAGRLLTETDQTAPFLLDWRKRYLGKAMAVAQPESADQVAQVVRWCAQHQIAVVPQGGNTGLVGGGVPDESGRTILLSLARMNRVRDVDTINNTITVEAGCILQNLQKTARDAGRLFPLSLGAEGSCMIGGNLSTNAGGVQVLRYGNARDLCLGLEVVTPSGEIWNGLRGLRKDNTGYDLKDLFIGAEGTLGVITAATMKLYPLPVAQVTAIATVPNPQSAMKLLGMAQARLGASLTGFELISDYCLTIVERHFAQCRRPVSTPSPWYVLLESSDSESEQHAAERFEALCTEALESNTITDAAIAASIAQSRAFWALRENVPEAQVLEGKNIKQDISVPISSIDRFIVQTSAAIETEFEGVR
ncbi:MAG: FAD-binding oxidoreductase, partial [Quisquiliibacterium sp.]